MIRTLTAASLVALGLAGAASAETRTFDVGNFTKIDISAGLDLEFQEGAAQPVTVENRKGDFSDIDVVVKGDTLVLKRKKNNWGWGRKREQYGITVSVPMVSAIEASSGSDVSGRGMSGQSIFIDVSSGADVTVIRTMGRWSSDIYRLYVRTCHEACASWTARACSTAFTQAVEFEEVDSY